MSGEKGRKAPTVGAGETILDEIHPEFIESGARKVKPQDVERLVEHADEILAKFTRGGALRRFSRDVGPMVALVRDFRSGTYADASYWTVAVITFTLAYVLKPIDIIPDALPIIGQLDDAVVVGHGVDMVRKELEAYREWAGTR
jgi:uncharacterized membrane protein YkvA (DUF1232 family)